MNRYLFVLLFSLSILAGCRSYVPMQEQLPIVQYKSQQKLVVSIVDSRPEKTDYSPQYVGTTIRAFGIPKQQDVSYLSNHSGDDQKSLAKYLLDRVEASLKSIDWDVRSVSLEAVPGAERAAQILAEQQAHKMLVLELKDWYFSINVSGPFGIHSASEFLFKNDTDVYIFDVANGTPYKKKIVGDHLIKIASVSNDSTQGKSYPNMFVYTFRNQLSKIINEPSVKTQLLN